MSQVLIQPKRRIEPSLSTVSSTPQSAGDAQVRRGSPILIEATISETHAKSAEISRHPVQNGLEVTDYIRTGPIGVEIEAAFSNQPICDDGAPDGIFAGDNQTRISAAWDAFLNLIDGRPRRELFQITTGLKLYDNMALENIGTSQSVDNPDSIIIRARFVEVRIVQSTFTTVPARSLRAGEAQERGQGDTQQGEQHATELPVCEACEDLCNECVRDNPAFAFGVDDMPDICGDECEPEYILDDGCIEDQNDLFNDVINNPGNANSDPAIAAICGQIDAVQMLDADTLRTITGIGVPDDGAIPR